MQLRTRKIQFNKASNKLERILSIYFFILLVIGTFLNLFSNRYYENGWTIGEWLINYEGGFVRRGLIGAIIYKITSALEINPIILIHFISILFFIIFLYLLKNSRKYFSSLFLLSPIVSLAPVLGNYLIRKDISGIVAYALCTNLIVRKKNLTNFLLINLISVISILNHESYFFYSVPSLALLHFFSSNNRNLNNNFIKKFYKSIIFIAPTFLVTILAFYFKGSYEIAFKINESWFKLSSIIPTKELTFPSFPFGAIESLSWSLDKGISLPLSIINKFEGGGLIWIPAVWMLIIFTCLQIFIGDKNKINSQLKLKALLMQFTFISPLFILGWDFGRWIFLWISSSIFLTISLIEIETFNKQALDNLNEMIPNLLIKFLSGYELKGYKKFVYTFIGIPNCCWSIYAYIKILPILIPLKILQF